MLLGTLLLISGQAQKVYADDSNVDYDSLAKKAEILNSNKEYQQVIDFLIPFSERKDNKNTYFFNELGTAFFIKKDYINANKYYSIAYKLNKDNALIIYNLAGSAALLNNDKEALKLFDLAESKGYMDKQLIDEWRVWINKKP